MRIHQITFWLLGTVSAFQVELPPQRSTARNKSSKQKCPSWVASAVGAPEEAGAWRSRPTQVSWGQYAALRLFAYDARFLHACSSARLTTSSTKSAVPRQIVFPLEDEEEASSSLLRHAAFYFSTSVASEPSFLFRYSPYVRWCSRRRKA